MRKVQTSKARRFRAHVECTFACQFRPPTLARSSGPMGRAVAVASELCKRGYEGGLHNGQQNAGCRPNGDEPINQTMFLLDVKGLYRINPWLIKSKPARADSFTFSYTSLSAR
jgi:hypothetical protein